MNKKANNQILEIGKGLYRGIFVEIAKEQGVTPEAVRQGFKRTSPKYVRLVLEKIRSRKEIANSIKKEAGIEVIPADYLD